MRANDTLAQHWRSTAPPCLVLKPKEQRSLKAKCTGAVCSPLWLDHAIIVITLAEMGLGHWISEAVADVASVLTGRKRKHRQQEGEDALQPPVPMSSSRPRLQQASGELQPLGEDNRVPQRLDFGSPAVQGQQRGQHGDSRAVPVPGAGGRRHAPPSRLGDALDGSRGVTQQRRQQQRQQQRQQHHTQQQQQQQHAPPGEHPPRQPFTKRFAPPSVHRGGLAAVSSFAAALHCGV